MGFKDFITNFGFRRQMAAEMERYQNLRPPENPSPRYVKKLVKQILNPEQSHFAAKELEMIGKPAGIALLDALEDPRYLEFEREDDFSHYDAPLDIVLGLLAPIEPKRTITAATPLLDSPSDKARKIAALHITTTGLESAAPLLKRMFADEEHYVRSYALIGLERAFDAGRLSEALREYTYKLMLEQIKEDWQSAGNECARIMILLDPNSSTNDLGNRRVLSLDNPNLTDVLRACHDASVELPGEILSDLFEKSMSRIEGKNSYPYDRIASLALQMLSSKLPAEQAHSLISRATNTKNEQLQESAAEATAMLAGIDDPVKSAIERMQSVGSLDRLTEAQRVVYCTFMFDVEVCNGGIMQFFGNSSGDHAADTLAALKTLGHEQAVAALEGAMQAVGPFSREPNRDMRLEAFAGRYDELQEVFSPLESAYYQSNTTLRVKMNLYAAEHAEDFR